MTEIDPNTLETIKMVAARKNLGGQCKYITPIMAVRWFFREPCWWTYRTKTVNYWPRYWQPIKFKKPALRHIISLHFIATSIWLAHPHFDRDGTTWIFNTLPGPFPKFELVNIPPQPKEVPLDNASIFATLDAFSSGGGKHVMYCIALYCRDKLVHQRPRSVTKQGFHKGLRYPTHGLLLVQTQAMHELCNTIQMSSFPFSRHCFSNFCSRILPQFCDDGKLLHSHAKPTDHWQHRQLPHERTLPKISSRTHVLLSRER